jgi:hypothetical protein
MLQSLALCCGCQVLLAVKLPAVNCPPNNCQPTEPARRRLTASRLCSPKKPCLLTDPALYTAAAWPRLYCRLTGPVQPITARRLLASAAAQPIRPLPLCTHVNSFERMSATAARLCNKLRCMDTARLPTRAVFYVAQRPAERVIQSILFQNVALPPAELDVKEFMVNGFLMTM